MGLARDLSMGPRRPRQRGPQGDYAVLARLTRLRQPSHADIVELRAVLTRLGRSPRAMLRAELYVYTAGAERLRALTGENLGPTGGTY